MELIPEEQKEPEENEPQPPISKSLILYCYIHVPDTMDWTMNLSSSPDHTMTPNKETYSPKLPTIGENDTKLRPMSSNERTMVELVTHHQTQTQTPTDDHQERQENGGSITPEDSSHDNNSLPPTDGTIIQFKNSSFSTSNYPPIPHCYGPDFDQSVMTFLESVIGWIFD